MNTALTKKELAALAGYSYQRLHTIDNTLSPGAKLFVPSEANDKKFDLAIFVQRWAHYNKTVGSGEEDELETAKARHETVKMRKTELEVARMEGEYVPLQEVDRMWGSICGTVSARLASLPQKLAPSLVMIAEADEIEAMIEREIRDAMNMMVATKLPGEENDTRGSESEEDGDE